MRKTKTYTLTNTLIQRYAGYLQEQERAGATIQKYVHDLTALLDFLDGGPLTTPMPSRPSLALSWPSRRL